MCDLSIINVGYHFLEEGLQYDFMVSELHVKTSVNNGISTHDPGLFEIQEKFK